MTISPAYPDLLQNGNPADATQVMANFYQIQNDVNANAAENGANSSITSLTGLTTPLSIAQGGTGASDAADALANLGAASSAALAAAIAAVQQVMTGSVDLFPVNSPPIGYLEANGGLYSRTTYAALWVFAQASGNIVADGSWQQGMFSTGDLSTTFRIPDLRGYFPRGWDDGAGVDVGRAIGTLQADLFAAHAHTITDPTHAHNLTNGRNLGVNLGGGTAYVGDPGTPVGAATTQAAATGITINNTGGTETRPKNVAMMYCIKT